MPRPKEKHTVRSLKNKKKRGEKLVTVTAYDYPTACAASAAGMDLLLVGDSLGMVVQGKENTLSVTMEQMIYHTRMVADAQPVSLVVADMPFGSYHESVAQAVHNAVRLIRDGGADAVKLEGGRKRFDTIAAILDAEIPVMAHLGLTPQSVLRLGGFRAQGRVKGKAEEMMEDALALEKMGVFSIVLESVPAELAERISKQLAIPTIGIGAGKHCDGQVLVFHDMMGFTDAYIPKFARKYAALHDTVIQALTRYGDDVRAGNFPGEAESIFMKKDRSPSDDGADS